MTGVPSVGAWFVVTSRRDGHRTSGLRGSGSWARPSGHPPPGVKAAAGGGGEGGNTGGRGAGAHGNSSPAQAARLRVTAADTAGREADGSGEESIWAQSF